MSFFKNLFKRKPGGTFFGNLLRGVANKATGGLLGNGAMMISQEDADKRDLSDADFIAKYGKTKTNVPVQSVQPNPNIMSVSQSLDNNTKNQVNDGKRQALMETIKKRWYLVLFPVVLIIVLAIKAFKNPRKRR